MPIEQKLEVPWRITFDTNPDQCNLHCNMCEEHSNYRITKKRVNRIMNFTIIEEAVENLVNSGLKEIIPSTMGEPLLYKNFLDLINLIKFHNIKINLTTNGTFPKLGVKEWAKLILPIASDVKISINGTSKAVSESIMEGLNFQEQISNIKNFVQMRDIVGKEGINHPTITFQATFMKRNIKEMPDLLRMAIKMDIDRFKGHHLWITHPELENESLLRDWESIKEWNITVEKIHKIVENKRLKNGRKIKLDNIYPIPCTPKNKKIPENFICPFLGKEAWIAWDGTFNVCCAPDELRRTLGNFGNVKQENFMELWNNQNYTNLIKNWGNYDVCKMCNMKRPKQDIKVC
ncbi:GTP 3',8-cyclase [subsurface metagenome]